MIFLDSNLWVYLLGKEDEKNYQAVFSLAKKKDIVVTVQSVNETIAVLLRKREKFNFSEDKVAFVLDFFYGSYDVVSFDCHKMREVIEKAVALKKYYQFPYYDSLLVASAMFSNCDIFYSQDLHDGLMVEDKIKIVNPLK